MVGTAAADPSLTPMVLQTVVAVALVALLATLGLAVAYAVVAGIGAWILLLVVGVLRLLWVTVRGAGRRVRRRLHRTRGRLPRISPETLPDLRVRPSG